MNVGDMMARGRGLVSQARREVRQAHELLDRAAERLSSARSLIAYSKSELRRSAQTRPLTR